MLRFKTYFKRLEERVLYNPLTHADLIKYLPKGNTKRLDKFFDKIKKKEGFLTKKGEAIIKDPAPDRDEFIQKGYKQVFNTNKGQIKYPSDFLKGPDFDGKGKGSGTAAEDRFLSMFRTELEDAMAKDGGGALPMLVGGREILVSGVGQPSGTPKADFFLLDDKGEQCAWLSHKDGRKSNDFQQYGGLTPRGTKNAFKQSIQVNSFIDKLKELFPNGMKSGDSVKRDLVLNKDGKDIALKSIYGINYQTGSGNRGLNNIDEFHQGEMKIFKKRGRYMIKSNHSAQHGFIPKDDYKCIFYARYSSDMNHFGIKSCRAGVFTSTRPAKKTEFV
tara:strand:- start:72 stop:1064 length:993 start_codon:yes stop_codon:yes gene_type:complete